MQDKKQIMLQNSEKAYKNKDYKTAISTLLDMVKSGYASGQVLCNLGAIFTFTKQWQNAVNSYQEALKVEPQFIPTYHNFGNLLKNLGKNKEALQVFIMGVRQNPQDCNLHNSIGMMYEILGQNENAITAYKNAVKVNPKFAKAVNNIAVILYKQKRYKESSEMFDIALTIDPNYHEVYSNLGASLNRQKRYDESIKALENAIEKLPKSAGAYTNLGNVYSKLYDYKKAQQLHEKSIELEPKGSNAYANLGSVLKNQGLTTKAIENYKKAIELDPNFVNAHFDLSTALLTICEFEEGLKEYEWRFKKDEMIPHIIKYKEIFSKPMLLKDTNAKDKIVLIHSEQGFGDSIMYARFIPKLKEKFGCRVVFKARDELVELFDGSCGIDEVYYRSAETPTFDYHLPIMSIAYICECTKEEDFYSKPYLFANDKNKFHINKEDKKPNIGICWSASVTGESYDGKVFDLKNFEPLINSDKVNIYSLQVGDGKEDIQKYDYSGKIIDLSDQLTNFAKTASLVKELDLVITSDTSVAHLCGAMGIKTWTLLQKYPDWRWTNKGEKSYMYPTNMKLIRQKTDRVWDNVFQAVYDRVQKEFKIKLG
jgi:tetratricopeptide (TPR) repeat protein/ADP-heptose:LPS heptosyltransferase